VGGLLLGPPFSAGTEPHQQNLQSLTEKIIGAKTHKTQNVEHLLLRFIKKLRTASLNSEFTGSYM